MVGCKKKNLVELSYSRVLIVSYIYAECMRIIYVRYLNVKKRKCGEALSYGPRQVVADLHCTSYNIVQYICFMNCTSR